MSWATRLLLVTYLAAAIVGIAGAQQIINMSPIWPGLALLVVSVSQLIGMWTLARSSRHFSERPSRAIRFLLRVSPIGPVISAAAAILMYFEWRNELPTVVVVGIVSCALGPTAVFVRMRAVARMIADPHLAEHSKIVAWGFFISLVVAPLLLTAIGASGIRVPNNVNLLMMGAWATSMLLFPIWGAFIMFCCVVDFGRAAKVAQAQWNSTVEV
jgi:hypothetical protein